MESEWWYRLDAADTVVEVGPGWDVFALANGGDDAVAERVLGRSLFDFVAGSPTRQLMTGLLRAVRAGALAVEVPFRCDAPDRRRYMSWRGELDGDGGVRIRTRLIEEEASSTGRLVAVARARGDGPVTVCSWCNRIHGGDGEWLDPEAASRLMALFMDRVVPALTHGICPTCRDSVMSGSVRRPQDA